MRRLGRRTFASLRKHRNYRLYFFGQVVSLSGTWMQNIALAWFVVELTHSPFAVGLLAFCRFAPFTVFGLAAGVLADRLDNRRLFAATQLVAMAVSIALAVLALTGTAELWQVYVLALVGGTALVFDGPTRHALTYQLVGRDELPNAIGLNVSLFNLSRLLGPAIAGGLIAAFGTGACFAVNAVSYLGLFAALALMREEEFFPVARAAERPTLVRGSREALAYAAGSPEVRTILVLSAALSVAGFNFHVLLPLLAADSPELGPEGFGLLAASFGAGALAGALVSATLGRASWTTVVVATLGLGTTLLALAPVELPVLAASLLFATGAFFTLERSNVQSILQLAAPDHLRGRVLSLYLFALGGLAPLGALLAGWLAETGGIELAFTVAGLTGLATGAAILATRMRAQRLVTG
jgi:MFS family permease